MPKTRKFKTGVATEAELLRVQEENRAIEGGLTEKRKLDAKTLARAAKVAYEQWIIEAGFQNDARIKEWTDLDARHQRRWASLARTVIESYESSGSEDSSGGAVSVQRDDVGAPKLRQCDGGAAKPVPTDRNRRARRGM